MALAGSASVATDLLQEAWQHMDAFQWAPGAIYSHCQKLAAMPVTTKEALEDLIGEAMDHVSRDSKKSSGAQPERTYYYNCISTRLRSIPYMGLEQGDFVNDIARKHSMNREFVFGERARVKSELAARTKEVCKQGGTKDFVVVCYIWLLC